MAATLRTPFPPPDLPLVDGTGRVNRVWLEFLVNQFRRTGAVDGFDLSALQSLVDKHTQELALDASEIADLQMLVESNPFAAAVAAILGRLAVLEMAVQGMPVPAPAPAAIARPVLPEPVCMPRRESDDIRKLIEG
ncbi:hypothetical protein [Paraburkholderia caribensis]|uniref:hypothetical protein n=1 Tax=Paraburkholderia caribensis TaxID=75105 RepID=UPI001CB21A75|nr:hypothetical protein [Paraburkholderia caribensis]CAG9255994.1 conserved hypothetical protein [Paraburkholderia caribensis]